MTAHQVFEKFIPKQAVPYCVKLYEKLGFEFKIKKSRRTKFGDYRYAPNNERHTITINNDLNPYAFLITYLHEVAHLVAFQKFGRRIKPHGEEWKATFRELSQPLLTDTIFDAPILKALIAYFKDPKASSCSDPRLYQVLKTYDNRADTKLLKEIAVGQTFQFNGRTFQKLEKKRTRSVCLELKTNRKYAIAEVAEVEEPSHSQSL